jgi:hypothetical protein
MFPRTVIRIGLPVFAGLGLLLAGGPAAADGQVSNGSYYTPAKSQPGAEQVSVGILLTATGVPNDNGQIRWPIGIAILAAPGADNLCDQIEALFQETVRQAAGGLVSPLLAEEARKAVKSLRTLLLKDKDERLGMPLAVYHESERFLDKLDRSLQLLREGMVTPGG